ncbi:hypothetical protein [Spirosoma fluviale]|uniref:Cytochrome C and Quinol oxidase polypeptide I n=1 Tax=Spirosoma fluviale TaxID=1597977 RepID=A0A286G063_9BACT|nr:hypothetical protein [Spirosoma fluviale]SOD88911.1 hypothetical protein SAMN06269250_2885 [Spirosoma fluviale]
MTFRKPYLISWLAMPVLILMGLVFRQHTVDVQLYDTYFVIANSHVALMGSAFLLVVGLGYWLICLTGKTPNIALTTIHLLPTIIVLMLLVMPLFRNGPFANAEWLSLGILAFLLGQCAYVIVIMLTLLRK